MSNNAINTDVEHARAFGAHVCAAGYGERSTHLRDSRGSSATLIESGPGGHDE
jgi:hypothetical protein